MAAVIGALRVDLSASVAKFEADMGKASLVVKNFGDQAAKVGKRIQSVGAEMSMRLTLPILAAGGAAIKMGGDFEAGMNRVGAATLATAAEFDNMKNLARELGSTTAFSATEAAGGMEMLAKNGLSYTQIMGGATKATLLLASAADTDLATAADIATDSMISFNKQASELESVANGIAGVLLVSKFGIDDYRMALGQAGGVAGGMGVTLSDFNTAIAATSASFASGSDAGTSFKTFLTRLAPVSKEAEKMIEALGLEFFDSAGNMKDMAAIAEELKMGLSGLNDEARAKALTTIFGTDSMRTAIQLMSQGAAGFEEVRAAIDKVSAQDQAAARLKGFNGQVRLLRSALEALAISIAESGLLEFITDLVQKFAAFIQGLSKTNPQLLKTLTVVAALAAAAGPLLIGLGGMVASFAGMVVIVGKALPLLAAVRVAIAAAGASALGAKAGYVGMAWAVGNLTYALVENSEAGQKAGRALGIWLAELKYGKEKVAEALDKIAARQANEAKSSAYAAKMAGEQDKYRQQEIAKMGEAAAKAAAELEALGQDGGSFLPDDASGKELQDLRDKIYPLAAALREYETALAAAKKAGIPAADATTALAKIAYDAAGGWDELKDNVAELPPALRALAEADKAVADMEVAKAARRLQKEVQSLDRQIFAFGAGGLSELDAALQETDMRYDQMRESISSLIEANKALAASSPAAAAALAHLEAQLTTLDAAYAGATQRTKDQIAADNQLRDAAAAAAAQDIGREISDLRQARGDAGVITSTQQELQALEEQLETQRTDAALRLMELETERDAAMRQNDMEEAARLQGLIEQQAILLGEVESTTAVQIHAAQTVQELFANFVDDMSGELATMISEWKFDLDGIRSIFADMAKKQFLQPFLEGAVGGATAGIGGLFKGFAGGFASGGFIPPGQWGIVGEQGPEMIKGGGSGATVYPSGSGGANITMIINTPNADSFRRSERQTVQGLQRTLGANQ